MPKPEYPSDKLDQYMVRFPDGMRDRLKTAAAENNRSMNAEIVARLEESFSFSPESIEGRLAGIFESALEQRIEPDVASTEDIYSDELNRTITQAVRIAINETIDRLALGGFRIEAYKEEGGADTMSVYVPSKRRRTHNRVVPHVARPYMPGDNDKKKS